MDANRAERTTVNEEQDIQAVVRSAQRELQNLMQQRAELTLRISRIKQTIAGLADLFGDNVLCPELRGILGRKSKRASGFTSACRAVLQEAVVPLSVGEIKGLLNQKYPGLIERHKDPVASITTVMTRLARYGEADCHVVSAGRRLWTRVPRRGFGSTASRGEDLAAKGESEPPNLHPEPALF